MDSPLRVHMTSPFDPCPPGSLSPNDTGLRGVTLTRVLSVLLKQIIALWAPGFNPRLQARSTSGVSLSGRGHASPRPSPPIQSPALPWAHFLLIGLFFQNCGTCGVCVATYVNSASWQTLSSRTQRMVQLDLKMCIETVLPQVLALSVQLWSLAPSTPLGVPGLLEVLTSVRLPPHISRVQVRTPNCSPSWIPLAGRPLFPSLDIHCPWFPKLSLLYFLPSPPAASGFPSLQHIPHSIPHSVSMDYLSENMQPINL